MSTAPKLPIERAREVMATWNADGTWREANALNLPGEVDDLADALEALIREHETLLIGLSRQLASAEAALIAREDWIDPTRVEALTIHPPISITPMRGVSMAGDRWIVSGGCGGRGVDYARTFPEALKIAEAHR